RQERHAFVEGGLTHRRKVRGMLVRGGREGGNPRHARYRLMQQLQPFGIELRCQHSDAGYIAAWVGESSREARGNRVLADERPDNRWSARRLLRRADGVTGGNDCIGVSRGELTCQRRQFFYRPE